MSLDVELIRRGDAVVVKVGGVADATLIIDVVRAVHEVDGGNDVLVVDLSDIVFLHSDALRDLLDALEGLETSSPLRLVPGRLMGRAMLQQCRTGRLPVYDSVSRATRSAGTDSHVLMLEPPLLRTSMSMVDGCVVLRLAGEIDLSNQDEVRRAIGMAVRRSSHRVEADLSELEFCDSSGMQALVHGHNLAARNGRRLVVRNPTSAVRRMLELTHLDVVLEIDD